MKKPTVISTGVIALILLVAPGAQANTSRVTQGDARSIFEAFTNGGWGVVLNGGTVEEGAPADFMPDSMARISTMPGYNGRHYCSLDWHVISVAAIEGNPAGGTRTNSEIRATLASINLSFMIDGAPIETYSTAIKRTTNPALRGYVEAFFIDAGRIMAPDEIAVGQHTLFALGQRPGRPPAPMGPITFHIDAAGTGACT